MFTSYSIHSSFLPYTHSYSGCVTSAETVLISQQSGGEFRRVLARRSPQQQHAHTTIKAVAIALAPQTLASLAVRLSTAMGASPAPLARVQQCLRAFFRHLAAHHHAASGAAGGHPLPVHVYGTAAASNLSLLESAAEFVARYRHWQQQQGQQGQPPTAVCKWEAPAPSRALSAMRDAAEGQEWGSGIAAAAAGRPAPPPRYEALPMLASACPGWVCYAEKTTPQALPYISTAKSPQQVSVCVSRSLRLCAAHT